MHAAVNGLSSCNAAATVSDVSASLSNNVLNVTWTSADDRMTDSFIVEAGKRDKNFTRIGAIKKGHSPTESSYRFSGKLPVTMAPSLGKRTLAILSILPLLAGGLLGRRRKKAIPILFSWGLAVIMFVSCSKHLQTDAINDEKVYVRIIQVDKNGSRHMSQEFDVVNK
jgi:hypothetical protein